MRMSQSLSPEETSPNDSTVGRVILRAIQLSPVQHFIGNDGALTVGEENRIGEYQEESRQG